MTETPKHSSADQPTAPWKIRGRVDNVPIPSQEILNYVLEQDTLVFKNLALHVVTTMVVADTIITAVEKRNKEVAPEKKIVIDRDTALETIVAHHASRPLTETGVKGKATEYINYMKTHTYTDLAILVATQSHLPLSIIQSMGKVEREGFPKKTVGPENPQRIGTIDWTVAMWQLATWSVAGTIVPIDKRFEDLIARHVDNPNSPYRFTKEDFIEMRDWGKERIQQLCGHLGIEPSNFHEWLKSNIQLDYPSEKAKKESNDLIRKLFHKEPDKDEFLPISPAYKYLAGSILSIEPPTTEVKDGETITIPNPQRKTVERLLARPERFLRLCQKYGLVKKDESGYKSL
ncbi:hypothetical protein KKE03_03020 [Patescibacteria group bacterium]|nr:hypothetical protein [Patescibacteria group bacterium]